MAESLLFLKNVIHYVSNRVEAKNRFILLCLFFNIHPSIQSFSAAIQDSGRLGAVI